MFAGGFDLGAVAAVFCGRNDSAAHDLADLLAGKSLVVAEPAAGGSRYRLLETIRQYAAEPLAEAEQARRRHAGTFLALAERERRLSVLLRKHDNFRAALDHAHAAGDPAGPPLARALGGFWQARRLPQEGKGWLERALATGPADLRLHADLLRLPGTVLYATGGIQHARTTRGKPSTQPRRPRAIRGRRRRYSFRCRCCTATLAVSPTPGRLSSRARGVAADRGALLSRSQPAKSAAAI